MPKPRTLLYLLALVKFLLPFFLQHSSYGLHRDEFLYLAEGRHLAWGYMEVPPLLSLFAWLTHLFGDSQFWIKCWPSLFGALTMILAGEIILSLKGRAFAILLLFLSFALTGYLRMQFLLQANFLEIFFWTLMAYSLIRYIQDRENNWLFLFGISVGLGMMSKYSVAFYLVSLLTGLALTRQRRVFAQRDFYLAALISGLIFLPNLIWQITHHLPLVHHMKVLQETQLQYIDPMEFLKGQFILLLPCLFIWLTGLFWVSFSSKENSYRFLGWSYAILILLLVLGHGKTYYAAGAYPPLLAFGAWRLEQFTSVRFKALRYVLVIIPLIIGYWFVPVLLPIFNPVKLSAFYEKENLSSTGLLKWEDLRNHPLPMDFADMLGWDEIARKTALAYESLDSNEKKHCFLFCDNYGQAGALNYYRKQYVYPEPYSDDASFLYWLPDSLNIENLILVTDDKQEMQHAFVRDFNSAKLFDSITNPYARERGSLICIFKGAHPEFNRMFRQKILDDKTFGHQ
jgi:4-amino-4-deoxy-L-arabinose transferase-like glycosyltransferase